MQTTEITISKIIRAQDSFICTRIP